MKNKEPISGSIIEAVTVRSGVHQYDEQNRAVIEITFKGYGCNYIQVVDMHTARSLMNQLKEILPPNYHEL
jgi:deoxyxylulose-5-phosphate synthase